MYHSNDITDGSYYWVKVYLNKTNDLTYDTISASARYKTREDAKKEMQRLAKEWGLLK